MITKCTLSAVLFTIAAQTVAASDASPMDDARGPSGKCKGERPISASPAAALLVRCKAGQR